MTDPAPLFEAFVQWATDLKDTTDKLHRVAERLDALTMPTLEASKAVDPFQPISKTSPPEGEAQSAPLTPPKKKRKRRTKAEMEADRRAEERSQTETPPDQAELQKTVFGSSGPETIDSPPETPQSTPEVPEATPATTPEIYTYDDARDAMRNKVARSGVPAARSVLMQFGATKVTELAQKDYAAAIREFNK